MHIRIRRRCVNSIPLALLRRSTLLFSSIFLTFLCTFLSTLSFAQQYPYPGFPPFSTQVGSQYDAINLADSNISLTYPLRSMTAGPVPLSFSLFGQSNVYVVDGNQWQITTPQLSYSSFSLIGPLVSNVGADVTWEESEQSCNGVADAWYTNFAVADSYGTLHPIPTDIIIDSGGCYPVPDGSVPTTDNSGYTILFAGSTGNWSANAYDKAGNKYAGIINDTLSVTTPDLVTVLAEKTTGCTGSGACVIATDALTNTPVMNMEAPTTTGGAYTYSYTNAQGTQSYTINYSAYTLLTNFGCSGIAVDGPVKNVASSAESVGGFGFWKSS